MRQSTIIFGTLLLAFVIYITLRGQLPAYLGLFTGANPVAKPAATNDNTSSSDVNDSMTRLQAAIDRMTGGHL